MRTDRIYEGDKYYYINCKCGRVKENHRNTYCKLCMVDMNIRYSCKNKDKVKFQPLLKSFVEKVNRRNGWVTLHDLFVDLITLHDIYSPHQQLIDTMKPEVQLTLMWKMVQKEYKNRIK